jgi:hypothetical protein
LIEFGHLVLEKKILKFLSAFLLLRYYLPLEKGYPLYLNKHESLLSKDNVCQVWLKLVQWFWRRRFLNYPTPFFHFCAYLPFEEDLALHLNKLEFTLPKDDLHQV